MAAGLASLCAVAAATPAHADDPAMAGAGGAFASMAPTITGLACVSGCVGVEAVPPGSVLRVRGREMSDVREVVFLGAVGPADDVAVTALRPRPRRVDVKVPTSAPSGPLLVRNADGAPSGASTRRLTIGTPATALSVDGAPTVSIVSGPRTSSVVDVSVEARTVYFGGQTPATLNLVAKGGGTTTFSVALVRVPDGTVVRRWTTAPLEPGATQAIAWDGKVGTQVPARAGRFQFQVWTTAGAGTASAAQAPEPEAADTFELRPYAFPIVGKHDYGEGMARFGAGRSGHMHEGQDVFAACGTPLVAARGGTVKFNDFQGNAGNYLVIDADGSGQDMAYMHLRDPGLPEKGDHVDTGEPIGFVGDTGDANGCHLHFELWTAPGWYTGGAAIDPLAALRAWDADDA
jgi:hypothetical protein